MSKENFKLNIVHFITDEIFIDKFVIERAGKKILTPIVSFLPINEYERMLLSCGIKIFAHERQQAVGNVNMSIIQGSKVYLSETSILYKEYKDLDIDIKTIQNNLTQNEIDKPLFQLSVDKNREVLIRQRSPEACHERLKVMLKELGNTVDSIN